KHFRQDEPLFRATWLRGEQEHDLLFTTSHRICDGASVVILVREILACLLESTEANFTRPTPLIPYESVTRRDLVADYRPPSPLKCKLAARTLNCVLRLIPESCRPAENLEHFL